MASPPLVPLPAFLAFPHEPVSMEALGGQSRRHRRNPNQPPALFRIFHQFPDDEGRQNASHLDPVPSRACADMCLRMSELLPKSAMLSGLLHPRRVANRGWKATKSCMPRCGYFFASDFAAAFFAAQRFFRAATMFALPAALILRFGFDAGDFSSGDFFEAHLFRCASAIAFRPAVLIFRRGLCPGPAPAAGAAGSMARSSAIWASILLFCSSKPRMAALMISFVSLGIAIFCL